MQQQSEAAKHLTVIEKRLEELQGLKHDLIKQLKQVRSMHANPHPCLLLCTCYSVHKPEDAAQQD
jgi:hypothetical protein